MEWINLQAEGIPQNREDGEVHGFHWVDYVVFALTLAFALFIGIYHGFRGQKTTSDYLSGNRQLHTVPVALSIFMSVISGVMVLGTSAEAYFYGTQIYLESFGRALLYCLSAHLFVPLMYNLKITSVFEYHTLRFGSPALHMTCVIIGIIASCLYMGLAMYAPSTALEASTGFPVWASIVCTGVVALIYTTMGGIKAVVWTDFLQGFILFAGLVLVLIAGCLKVGGMDEVWQISKDGGRIIFFNMDPDPTVRMTFWGAVFGGGITAISQSGYEQSQIQRYCALASIKDAKRAVYLQGPLLIIAFTLVGLVGLTAYAYYASVGCDPYRSGQISNFNQIVPYFLVDVLNYPGLPGIFVAVLFSGALSSISSSMNSLAAITWKDIIEKHVDYLSEMRKTLITKFLALVYGVIGIAIGFMMQKLKSHVMQIAASVLGGFWGPMAGIILAGALFPCVQWKGAMIGLLSAIGLITWMNIGQFIYHPHKSYLDTNVDNCTLPPNGTFIEIEEDDTDVFWLYRVSYIYIAPVGYLTSIGMTVLASFITGKQDPRELDPRTIINVADRFGCCCSENTQEKYWCGVSYDQLDQEEKNINKDEMFENDLPSTGSLEKAHMKAKSAAETGGGREKSKAETSNDGRVVYTVDTKGKLEYKNTGFDAGPEEFTRL